MATIVVDSVTGEAITSLGAHQSINTCPKCNRVGTTSVHYMPESDARGRYGLTHELIHVRCSCGYGIAVMPCADAR